MKNIKIVLELKAIRMKLSLKLNEMPETIAQEQEFLFRQPIIKETIRDIENLIDSL